MTQQANDADKTQSIPGPFCCPGCEARGENLDGFSQHTYECPRCGRIWHIAGGEKVFGFPVVGNAGDADLACSPDTLNFVYPALHVDDLVFGLAVARELITADDLDGDRMDRLGWTSPPSLADVEHRLPLVEITSYRTFINAIRQRHRSARKRFSVAERTLLLLAMARRGALGDWVQLDEPADLHFVHPAVLLVTATMPYAELIALPEEEFECRVRETAEQESTYTRSAR